MHFVLSITTIYVYIYISNVLKYQYRYRPFFAIGIDIGRKWATGRYFYLNNVKRDIGRRHYKYVKYFNVYVFYLKNRI